MKAEKMAGLFDIELGENLKEKNEGSEDASLRSFDDRCEDITATMETEKDSETQVIEKAVIESKPEGESEIPGDVDKVEADILQFEKGISESSPVVAEQTPPKEAEQPVKEADNPLGLEGQDLLAYHEIKKKFPQFNLYDGSLAFRDFYRHKVFHLRKLLGRFPFLDIGELTQEVRSVNTNHFVDDDYISPDIIRKKLDDVQRCRTRLTSILVSIYEQFYPWERYLEMLKSKLWKDHELKGAHRRDGLVVEHLNDMESYYSELKSFLEATKQVDGILKAAAESLSRQLTCLQLKATLGLSPREQNSPPKFENYDGVTDGTVIPAPKPGTGAVPIHYEKSDDMAILGI